MTRLPTLTREQLRSITERVKYYLLDGSHIFCGKNSIVVERIMRKAIISWHNAMLVSGLKETSWLLSHTRMSVVRFFRVYWHIIDECLTLCLEVTGWTDFNIKTFGNNTTQKQEWSSEDNTTTREFHSLRRIQEFQPVRGMRWKESHWITFVDGKSNTHCISNQVDELLEDMLISLNHLECRRNGKESLKGTKEQHANHHNRKDGDGVSSHPHDEEIHWDLLNWSQGNVPRSLLDAERRKEAKIAKKGKFHVN